MTIGHIQRNHPEVFLLNQEASIENRRFANFNNKKVLFNDLMKDKKLYRFIRENGFMMDYNVTGADVEEDDH